MNKNLATLQSRYSLVEQDKKVPPKVSMIGGELGQVVVQHFVFTPIWNQLVGPIFTIREMGPTLKSVTYHCPGNTFSI